MQFRRVKDDATIEIGGNTWNDLVNRIERIETKVINSNPQDQKLRELMVRNETGTNIPPFRIVKIGDPVVLPGQHAEDTGYKFQNVFNGEATDAGTIVFGITQKGIPADIGAGSKGVGQVITEGVSTALVNVTDMAHNFAKPSAATGVLESTAETTSVQILYAQSASEHECKVLIGFCAEGLRFAQAPAGGLPARVSGVLGEAVCDVLISAPSAGTNYVVGELVKTGETITIQNYGSSVVADEGDRIIQHDGTKIVGYDCANSGDPNDFETLESA